jgi:hypothetical protein
MTKRYDVTDVHGVVHEVLSDFMFNNGGELTFRTGERGNTEIAAIFPKDRWTSCVAVIPDSKLTETEN